MNPRNWSMKRKFVAGTLAVTLTAITFVSAFLIISEQRMVHTNRAANTKAFVEMIANNAAASLMFEDEQVAQQILGGARAEPSTRAAALYKANGRLFASFIAAGQRPLPPAPLPASVEFFSESLDAFADVMSNGKKVGTAYLRTDLSAMHARFRGYIVTVIGCAAAAILLSFLLAQLMQRWIAESLSALSRTAKTISAERNFALRAQKISADEVGEVVDAFNHMVAEVQNSQLKIQAHADHLEKEVAERTARLREMVAELEAFSYSVTHDLRAPLRAIRGYAEIVMETPAGTDAVTGHHLRRIARSAERMDRLITDILNYSQVAKAEMEIVVVDLDDLVSDVLADYPQFVEAGAQIEVRPPLGRARGHNAALSQVFSNLISNAVKFVPRERRAKVTIWAREQQHNRRIYVQDNGPGIPETELPRLFRIFERVSSSAQVEGTGIGLSIVKKAMEKMNGTVGVTSEVGVGTTFWIELPDASSA